MSTDTIIVGGSAQRWVADRPSRPAGPLSERAVTIVLPIARWLIECQNCLTSMGSVGMGIHHYRRSLSGVGLPKVVIAMVLVQD